MVTGMDLLIEGQRQFYEENKDNLLMGELQARIIDEELTRLRDEITRLAAASDVLGSLAAGASSTSDVVVNDTVSYSVKQALWSLEGKMEVYDTDPSERFHLLSVCINDKDIAEEIYYLVHSESHKEKWYDDKAEVSGHWKLTLERVQEVK